MGIENLFKDLKKISKNDDMIIPMMNDFWDKYQSLPSAKVFLNTPDYYPIMEYKYDTSIEYVKEKYRDN